MRGGSLRGRNSPIKETLSAHTLWVAWSWYSWRHTKDWRYRCFLTPSDPEHCNQLPQPSVWLYHADAGISVGFYESNAASQGGCMVLNPVFPSVCFAFHISQLFTCWEVQRASRQLELQHRCSSSPQSNRYFVDFLCLSRQSPFQQLATIQENWFHVAMVIVKAT